VGILDPSYKTVRIDFLVKGKKTVFSPVCDSLHPLIVVVKYEFRLARLSAQKRSSRKTRLQSSLRPSIEIFRQKCLGFIMGVDTRSNTSLDMGGSKSIHLISRLSIC